jgi:hypothetical protein
MKLFRHFLATSLAVAVVVLLGLVWSHSGAASIVADGSAPPPDRAQRGGNVLPIHEQGLRGAGGFNLSNIGDLIQTLVILALITTAVVVIDRLRRRHGRQRFPSRSSRPVT